MRVTIPCGECSGYGVISTADNWITCGTCHGLGKLTVEIELPGELPVISTLLGEKGELKGSRTINSEGLRVKIENRNEEQMIWAELANNITKLAILIIEGIPVEERRQWYIDNIKPLTDWIREHRQ